MRNLSGIWRGLYSYPVACDPVPFTARLRHAEEWLTGTTAETAPDRTLAGSVLTATVTGRIGGQHVTFLKTYDRQGRDYDAVHYEGDVDAEGQEVWGRWTIQGSWSGTFLMIRASGTEVALSQRWAERGLGCPGG